MTHLTFAHTLPPLPFLVSTPHTHTARLKHARAEKFLVQILLQSASVEKSKKHFFEDPEGNRTDSVKVCRCWLLLLLLVAAVVVIAMGLISGCVLRYGSSLSLDWWGRQGVGLSVVSWGV